MQRSVTMTLGLALLMLAPVALALDLKPAEEFALKAEVPDTGILAPLGCSLGAGRTVLSEGVSQSGQLTNQVGANCEFLFTPAAGSDIGKVVLSGLNYDYDLYVKRGSPPTTSSYDCRPFSGGTTVETCNVLADGQDFYIMVRRFSGSLTGNFTVTASSITLPELMNGQPVQGNVAHRVFNLYKVNVPAGSQLLGLTLAGSDPQFLCRAPYTLPCTDLGASFKDADLYVRRGTLGLPTTSLFDCRSFNYGTNDACIFSNELAATPLAAQLAATGAGPQIKPFLGPGKYFVGVYGFSGPADYAVTAVFA